MRFFELEWDDKTKQDWYMARLTYQVYLLQFVLGGDPSKTVKDFLMDFEKETPQKALEVTEEARRQMIQAQKLRYLAWAGLKSDGTVRGKKVTVRKPPKPIRKA